ncbi:hypothetical protein KR093_011706 [Drosophila rubida]|uniref:Uncharacterized protein n=1 Tax=Drosophila rubida TaxID=30044 RepID=A0AAD4K2M6_9MUSC|nr:hypothetical protein KR093_011706 [Drosophila rubida]
MWISCQPTYNVILVINEMYIIILLFYDSRQEAVLFKFTNAICKSYDETQIFINQCRLRAVSRNVTTFNYNATNFFRIDEARLKVQILKKANGFKPWVVKADIDGCRFLKKSYNPLFKIIFSLFQEFSNMNHTCPYLTGDVVVQGFYLKLSRLPHAIPTGEYLANITWIFNKKVIVLTSLYFMFIEDMI